MPITPETRTAITDALELGMPLKNAADLVELKLDAVHAEMAADPEFDIQVNKAIAQCMRDRLEMLAGLKNWQALAFILTSLWPARFGRGSKGVPGAAKLLNSPHLLDFSLLDPYETQWFDYVMAKLNGRDFPRPDEAGRGSTAGEPRTEVRVLHPRSLEGPRAGN